jgi:dUTP pyrophosphatase
MKYKRLYKDSFSPRSPKNGDNGYDLPAQTDITLFPNIIYRIPTGLAFEIPKGYGGIILGRSGKAFNNHIECWHNGLIDMSYRGEIEVLLKNHSDTSITIKRGDYIAQMVIVKTYTEPLEESDVLEETKRGIKGFGSSDQVLVKELQNKKRQIYIVFDGGNGGYKVNKGYGSYIIRENDRHGEIIEHRHLIEYAREMTSNEAEYRTLETALMAVQKHYVEEDRKNVHLIIEGDSELVRNQIGTYDGKRWDAWQCNKITLRSCRDMCRTLLLPYNSFTYNHVPREYIVSILGH